MGETVIFKLNGSRSPKMFSIKGEKPRVVFDFFNTVSSALINHTINTRGNLIQRIRVGIHHKPKPKTRVVIDLVPGKQIKVEKKFNNKENILIISVYQVGQREETKQDKTLRKAVPLDVVMKKEKSKGKEKVVAQKPSEAVVGKTPSSPAKPEDSSTPLLREVTFKDTPGKGEMVLFKLNDFYPPIVFGLEKGEPRVVCDFLGTTLSKDVKRVIDSNGKFVKRIRLAKHKNPDKIRVVLDLVPNSSYDLQQVFYKEDNLFVIIINPFAASEETEAGD